MNDKFQNLLNAVIKKHGTKVTRADVHKLAYSDLKKYCTPKTFLQSAKKLDRGQYDLSSLVKSTKKLLPADVRKSPKKLLTAISKPAKTKEQNINNYYIEEELTPFNSRFEL